MWWADGTTLERLLMIGFAFWVGQITANERLRGRVPEFADMSEHPYGWLALLPPVVAILLAILTRKILLSLLAAIFVGALVLGYYSASESAAGSNWAVLQQAAASAWQDHLWPTLLNPDKVSVFIFTCLMGAIVGMVNRAAGMRGLLELMAPIARSVPGLQISTWFSGMLVFFDDYANTMLLGTTYRSAYDRLKISREKLAYIVDSTAAPVAGLAIVSTWIAGELDYINQGLAGAVLTDSGGGSAFQLFLASIPYRFYVLWALFFVLLSAVLGRDFGPMLTAERRARRTERESHVEDFALPEEMDWARLSVSAEVIPLDMTEVVAVAHDPTLAPQRTPARSGNAILPIAVTVTAILTLMYQTGLSNQETPSSVVTSAEAVAEMATAGAGGRSLEQWGEIFGNADSYGSLVWGSVIGLIFTWLWLSWQRIVPAAMLMQAAGRGAAQMVPALAILWLASTLSVMTSGTPSEPYQRELDRAASIAQAIAGIERVEDSFRTADRLTRVQETLRLHQVPDGVIVETMVGQYQDPKAFFNQVLSRVADPRVDGQFYSRYLVLDGKQVDWDRFIGPIKKPQLDYSDSPTDARQEPPPETSSADPVSDASPGELLPTTLSTEPASGSAVAAGGPAAPAQQSVGQLMYQGAQADPSMDDVWQNVDDSLSFPYTDIGRRLHTGRYLSGLLTRMVGPVESSVGEIVQHPFARWLPTLVFILAGFTAFSTGTSWGTMGIIMPLAIPLAGSMLDVNGGPIDPGSPIFLATIAGVLAGAIFGDHCSPISDTTVLSSNASGCPHLAHVWTQMPYALTVGGVTVLFGTIPVGWGLPWWICLPLGTVVLVAIMVIVGRPVDGSTDPLASSSTTDRPKPAEAGPAGRPPAPPGGTAN